MYNTNRIAAHHVHPAPLVPGARRLSYQKIPIFLPTVLAYCDGYSLTKYYRIRFNFSTKTRIICGGSVLLSCIIPRSSG